MKMRRDNEAVDGMVAVIFEVIPAEGQRESYLSIAADLRPLLSNIDGFISIERFQSMSDPTRLLSLSFWRDESAIAVWRNTMEHRHAQLAGRAHVFEGYRIRVARVMRDYGAKERNAAPDDSRAYHRITTNGPGAGICNHFAGSSDLAGIAGGSEPDVV